MGFEDARSIIAANVSPQRASEIFAGVGAALLQCQNFENRLAEFIVLLFRRTPTMSEEQARELVEELSGKTLGTLLVELRKHARISDPTEQLLKQFLAERNWLAHRVQRENGNDLFDAARFAVLRQRLQDVNELALHLQREFQKIVLEYVQALGISMDEIERETLAEVKRRLQG